MTLVYSDSLPSLPCVWYVAHMTRWPSYESKDDEFLSRTQETDHGLIWIGPTHPPYGYGRMRDRTYAHRYSWERVNGLIPTGMIIDHQPKCPKSCVDIRHLNMFTVSEHVALGWQRGEVDGGWKRAKRRPTSKDPVNGRFTRDAGI